MRGRARFHADQTGRQRCEEQQRIVAAQPLADNDFPIVVYAMSLKDILETNSDCGHASSP